MTEELIIKKIQEIEDLMNNLQARRADRDRAVALTYIQTAKLWLMREKIELSWQAVSACQNPED